MINLKRTIASAIISAALTIGVASTAFAITAYPAQGGVWDYGVWGTYANSNYLHQSKNHGSSVVVDGGKNSSVCIIAGRQSTSAKWYWTWSSKQYYYRLC